MIVEAINMRKIIVGVFVVLVVLFMASLAFADQLVISQTIGGDEQPTYVVDVNKDDGASCANAALSLSDIYYKYRFDRTIMWSRYEYIKFVCISGNGNKLSSGKYFQVPKTLNDKDCLKYEPKNDGESSHYSIVFDKTVCGNTVYKMVPLLIDIHSDLYTHYKSIYEENEQIKKDAIAAKNAERMKKNMEKTWKKKKDKNK